MQEPFQGTEGDWNISFGDLEAKLDLTRLDLLSQGWKLKGFMLYSLKCKYILTASFLHIWTFFSVNDSVLQQFANPKVN